MPPPVDPQAFEWLTTEKAAGLVAIIAAIGAYIFGGRKRTKEDATIHPASVSMQRTNELLEELIGVARSSSRRDHDEEEARLSVIVQIRELIKEAFGQGHFIAAPTPPPGRRRPATKKPSTK